MKRTYRDRYEILINLPEREGADYADLSKEAWEKKEKIEWKGRSLYGTKTIFIYHHYRQNFMKTRVTGCTR